MDVRTRRSGILVAVLVGVLAAMAFAARRALLWATDQTGTERSGPRP